MSESVKLCRLCLASSPTCTSLKKDDGIKMVESLTQIKLSEEESTTWACLKCWLNVKLAYKIQQNILKANEKFLSKHSEEPNIKQECVKEIEIVCENVSIKDELAEFYDDCSVDEDAPLGSVGVFEKKCRICGEQLKKSTAAEHMKEHFSYCAECGVDFSNVLDYRNHMILVHQEEKEVNYNCDQCNVNFQYKTLYNIHMERAHNFDQVNETVPIKVELTENCIFVKSDSEDIALRDLGIRLKSKKALAKLEKDSNEVFGCGECTKTFNKESLYLQHVKTHKRKKCPICDAEITRYNFRKHVLMHSAGPAVCHLCGVTYKNYDSLRGHLYYTHSTNTFPCEHCGKVFKKSYARNLHVKKDHTGEKSHVCDTCGKGFFTQYCLSKHIKMTHLKLRPYICQHCNKGFSSKFALRTHERQHTNDAPYKCEFCGEGFRQNVSLRAHKKSRHNVVEEKNCKCNICGKLFISDWAVKSHMRLH